MSFTWNDTDLSTLEAVFARGDRRLAKVLARAVELGCRMDSWDEYFSMEKWQQAFADCGLDYQWYASVHYPLDQTLPWDHISCGVSKAFLKREYLRAMEGVTTPDCRLGCQGCGITCISEKCRSFVAAQQKGESHAD